MAMSDEERRAKNAEKQRIYRARKAAEREAEKTAASNARTVTEPPSVMLAAVDEALAAMKWLVPSDQASRVQARELAKVVDQLMFEGDLQKALSAHGRLSRALNDMGATPLARLHQELRSLKHSPKTEGEDGDEGKALPSNVSKFERPAKRRT